VKAAASILVIPIIIVLFIGFNRTLPIKNITLDLRTGVELYSFDLYRNMKCDVGIHNSTKNSEGVLFVEETKYLSHKTLISLYPDLKNIRMPKPKSFPAKGGYFVVTTQLNFYCNPIQTFFPVTFRIEKGYLISP